MPILLISLLVLQTIQVLILWLHDWLPLPPLNDVAAMQAADGRARLIRVTVLQSLPWTIGLAATLRHAPEHWPGWLWWYLWISYGLLFTGELRAWWIPYLVRADPKRAARYRAMFGATHSFLPPHRGMVPNTLHVMLHACTAATLLVLAALSFW